jgi:xanthine dehydrogenase molybdopterin-binding subunit B
MRYLFLRPWNYILLKCWQGMVIGAILAVDQETAQRAARLVRVDYEDLPALITMEEVGGTRIIVSQ